MENCCAPKNKNEKQGIFNAIIAAIVPHSFCIAFIVFSVLGVTAGVSVVKNFLTIPYFFETLIAISFLVAIISSLFYLKRLGMLSFAGIKTKWKYLTIMFSSVILVNLFMFFVVFPAFANSNNQTPEIVSSNLTMGTLAVDIPCSGHAPLIIYEVKKVIGVNSVWYKSPNIFEITYNPNVTSISQIASLEIFKRFKATIQ